jgi:hypothetical protein
MDGREKMMMDFRQASPRKEVAKTIRKRTTTGSSETQGQIKFTAAKKSNPISRQRSLQQIQKETEEFDNSHWGDSDDDREYAPDDPIEVDGEGTDVEGDLPLKDLKRRRISGPGQAGPSTSATTRKVVDLAGARDVDRGDTASPVDFAYKQLKEMYAKVRWVLLSIVCVLMNIETGREQTYANDGRWNATGNCCPTPQEYVHSF